MENLLNNIENIKEKLSSEEYKQLMEAMQVVHKNKESEQEYVLDIFYFRHSNFISVKKHECEDCDSTDIVFKADGQIERVTLRQKINFDGARGLYRDHVVAQLKRSIQDQIWIDVPLHSLRMILNHENNQIIRNLTKGNFIFHEEDDSAQLKDYETCSDTIWVKCNPVLPQV